MATKPDSKGAVRDGQRCAVVGGTHAGKSGTVRDVNTSKTGHVTITVVQANGERFKTLARNVVVTPAGRTPKAAQRVAAPRKRSARAAREGSSRAALSRGTKATSATESPVEAEKRLKEFISRFEPKHQALIRAVRKALRKRFPTSFELAYDNYNFFVLGYGPTERPSECIVSMAAGANGVGLCFVQGAKLSDPKKILLGSGSQTRFIRLESVDVLARPEVEALLAAAVAVSKAPFRATGSCRLVIRSISAKQRPRRKPAK